MIPVRVVSLPAMLKPDDYQGRTVVVFDVLRATTTMAAAIDAGVREIRVFDSIGACQLAAGGCSDLKLIAGEKDCLPPEGFDLGNSPGDYVAERCGGKTMFMSTTNGTRALHAARGATKLLTGAIVNARATADAISRLGLPATLLCAGTNGQIACEDLLGCGAVIARMRQPLLVNDEARAALWLWEGSEPNLAVRLAECAGGQNVINAGLAVDVAFAAGIDRFTHACQVIDRDGVLVVSAANAYDPVA